MITRSKFRSFAFSAVGTTSCRSESRAYPRPAVAGTGPQRAMKSWTVKATSMARPHRRERMMSFRVLMRERG
jgi:hypothetical protein